mgnify:FL=1
MPLSRIFASTSIALLAAVSASLFTEWLNRTRSPDKLALREIQIMDEKGHPTAAIASYNGRTTLIFYSPDTPGPAIELGVEDSGRSRFLRIFGR